jgi:hypothetical protein
MALKVQGFLFVLILAEACISAARHMEGWLHFRYRTIWGHVAPGGVE